MIAAWCAAVFVVLVGWRVKPSLASRSLAPAVAHRPWRRRPFHRARPIAAVALADYLEALSQELRVGAPLSRAFVVVVSAAAPSQAGADPFATARQLVIDGQPLIEALGTVPVGSADVALAVQALRCAAALGGPAAPTLDSAAAVLRDRAAVAADLRSQSAQARLSARVLTVVPIAFALWGVAGSARTRHAYLATPVGTACVLAGVALNTTGWWWMRRIIGRAGQ